MSWELMRTDKTPCKCGIGFLIEESYSDDWNRSETKYRLECDECNKKYRLEITTITPKPHHEFDRVEYIEKQ